MTLSLSGASRALGLRLAPTSTRSLPKSAAKDRRPVAPRDPGLDDRLLNDIGISRADLAALWL